MKIYLIFFLLIAFQMVLCQDDNTYCNPKTLTGENCTIPCYQNCLNKECYKDERCINCNPGYMGNQCEINCPENCKECKVENEELICDSCKESFYGKECQFNCSNCPDGKCNLDGDCLDESTKCKDDSFYGKGCNTSCTQINSSCITCNREEECLTCKESFYGNKCQFSCSNCPDGKCNHNGDCLDESTKCKNDSFYGKGCNTSCIQINSSCITCNRKEECLTCKESFYGNKCQFNCSNCPDGKCNHNGDCLDESTKCKNDSFYGKGCNTSCIQINSSCITCNREEECLTCKESFYGNKCQFSCSNCPDGKCNLDGDCLDESTKCKDDSFYGKGCNTSCTQINSSCITCNREEECLTCKESFYGNKCQFSCSNCPDGKCNHDGDCLDESTKCINDSYHGKGCNISCSTINDNCLKCNRVEECSACKDSFYGNDCKSNCSNCPDGKCSHDGKCLNNETNCINDNFYGEFCNDSCSNINCLTCNRDKTCISCNKSKYGTHCEKTCENCYDQECDINGRCKEKNKCKNSYFYNEFCNATCQKNCSNEGCDMTGKCKSKCSKDHYRNNSDFCDKECEKNCKDRTCDDSTGICQGCEDERFYGDFCNERVENNPEMKNCNESTQYGEICKSCKDGIFYGNKCENNCSFGCSQKFKNTNNSMCQIDGRCEGCLLTYFGPFCNETCDGCGEYGCDDQGYCKEFKCLAGKYGLKCDENCNCEINSNSLECGKFSGECLNCAFGYFGKNCQRQCNYKCKTGLCCIFKEDKIEPAFSFRSNYKYLNIDINNKTYKIEIDYNYGYPLTLFNTSSKTCTNIKNDSNFGNIKGIKKSISIINFTNYQIHGNLYKESSYKIKNNQRELPNIDVIIADEIDCQKVSKGTKDVSGVIGLGFFNSVSNSLFSNNSKNQNILSYSINKKKTDEIEFQFGSMGEEQTNYIDKLTSCQVIFKNGTDIQGKTMTCVLNGIKSSKHSSGLRLNNASITFSLGQNSSFILNNDDNYRKYLENEYFIEKPVKKQDNDTKNFYYLYPEDKINKLSNLGFVFNSFYYSYEPNLFFKKELEDGKKRFLIEFSNEHPQFILGKEFLEDIKFTINNEEARIYFYAQNAEYSDKLKDKTDSGSFKIQLEARQIAAILLAVIIFFNLVIFAIYYFLKKKKMNSNDYISID